MKKLYLIKICGILYSAEGYFTDKEEAEKFKKRIRTREGRQKEGITKRQIISLADGEKSTLVEDEYVEVVEVLPHDVVLKRYEEKLEETFNGLTKNLI